MIYCIGRNYANHAKELGNQVPTKPVVFFKPPASIVQSGEIIKLPPFSENVQFETELAFDLDENLNAKRVCVANDLTARDQQKIAQETKAPWSLAKGFKQSCGIGNWVMLNELRKKGIDTEDMELRLAHNGRVAQRGFTRDMIFKIPTVIQYLKENFPIEPGDIVLTGTPEGVSTLKPGDKIIAELLTIRGEPISRGVWTFE